METITKKYVNTFIKGKDWHPIEVEFFDDPENIDVSGIDAFCFLECSYEKDGEMISKGQTKKCSPNYYIGTRVSIIEALELTKGLLIHEHFKFLAENYPNISICKTDKGYLIEMWNENDITLEEYIASKNKNK